MKITYPDGSVKEIEIKEISAGELLKELDIDPLEIVIAKNGKIVSKDDIVKNEDELGLLRIMNGG